MAVEIKQMVIKSRIVSGKNEVINVKQPTLDIEALKESMIEVCKELISEKISQIRER